MQSILEPGANEDFQKSREYQAADIWFRSYFVSHPAGKYELIYEFALAKWEQVLETKKQMESKADGLLKFVAALAAGIIAIAKSSNVGNDALMHLVPALVLFAVSAMLALAALKTVKWPNPMSVKDALTECHPSDIEIQRAQLAASLHCVIAGSLVALRTKARLIDGANACGILGVASLAWFLFS